MATEPGSTAPAPPGLELDRTAVALRGFGPLGVLASVVIVLVGPVVEPLGALLVWAWARRSRTPARDLGLARPRNWAVTIAGGITAGVLFKLAMKSLVMPLFGAPPVNAAYHFLAGNTAALPGMLFDVIVGAGFNEELVFRGFLFMRLFQRFGTSLRTKVVVVLVTGLWFGLLHYPGQGLPGAQQAAVTGIAFGIFYAVTGRLWPLVFAHAAFDVTAVVLIYNDLETTVAHWFFR